MLKIRETGLSINRFIKVRSSALGKSLLFAEPELIWEGVVEFI